MGVRRWLSQRQHVTMKITSAVKKVLKKLNSLIKKEKKLAKMEQDNFLNESFEEEIEENLQNELLEAKLALVLAMAAPCERINLRLQVSSSGLNMAEQIVGTKMEKKRQTEIVCGSQQSRWA